METTITRNVKDIAADERRALEGMLGHPLAPEQQVFIVAYTPGEVPDDQERSAVLTRIEKRLAQNHAFAADQGITTVEADEVIADAIEATRRRK
jgi:hypothetical protein